MTFSITLPARRRLGILVVLKDIESLKEHMVRFEQREKELVSSYEELKKVLEGSQ